MPGSFGCTRGRSHKISSSGVGGVRVKLAAERLLRSNFCIVCSQLSIERALAYSEDPSSCAPITFGRVQRSENSTARQFLEEQGFIVLRRAFVWGVTGTGRQIARPQ